MKSVAILSSVRTPIGKANKGLLRDTRPDTLAALVLEESIKQAGLEKKEVEDVIMGCAMPEAEQGMNVARISALLAGFPNTVCAATVNRFCSSGLHAIADVAKSIQVGQIEVGIGGGVESMSLVPMGGNRFSANPKLMEVWPEVYTPMGLTAENVSKKFGITREKQDAYSVQSHQRAVEAIQKGYFAQETIPVHTWIYESKGPLEVKLLKDEGPRADTSLETLSKLKPVFDTQGSVTAGNSSQISDGAAASVLMEGDLAKQRGLKPLGYFRGFVTAGVPPEIMGIGPVPAIEKLLSQFKLSKKDISVYEINEAFAAQVVYCIEALNLDPAIVNPNGGAVALGHPLGCTGARQVAGLLRELKRRQGRYGVVSMCIGGGMGAAGLIEANLG